MTSDHLFSGRWHKSSYSDPQNNCVEHAQAGELHGVRDSKDRDGAVLTFDHETWSSFLDAVRAGDLD